jgi:lipoprotein-releasing system permease protein
MVVEWTLAIRYLKSPHRGFASLIAIFSFLGILLGVATLIIVTSVMNGFQSELLGKLMGMKGHLLVYPHEHPLMSSDLPKLSHPNIQAAVPLIEKQAIIMCHGQTKGMMIYISK